MGETYDDYVLAGEDSRDKKGQKVQARDHLDTIGDEKSKITFGNDTRMFLSKINHFRRSHGGVNRGKQKS